MADAPVLERTSLSSARRRALLPRRMLLALVGLLCLIGIRTMLRPAPAPVVRTVAAPAAQPTAAVSGFAEAFARAYLSWNTSYPQQHEADLAPFLGHDVDIDAGLPVPGDGRDQTVTWTTTVEQTQTDPGRIVVTVAVAIDGQTGLRYLTVPVSYDRAGAMAVTDYPALVGAPHLDQDLAGRDGYEIDNDPLTGVVQRALGNYLSGASDNLRADVAPGDELVSPTLKLKLDDVVSLQWAGRARGRVSAVVVARDPAGVAYTLRYELAVVHRDRWYVAEINPPMTRKESRP